MIKINKSLGPPAALLLLAVIWGSPALAAETSGTLSTGIGANVGAVMEGVVVAPGDVGLSSDGIAGEARLPAGTTSLQLSNSTAMNLAAGVSTATAGNITVGGIIKPLNSFTGGDLNAVNLSAPITIGGQTMIVAKAVAIQSGIDNQLMILTNSDLAGASVSIPDNTTVLAPADWDGKIYPPTTGGNAGTPPSGFQVGSTVVEIGSPTGVLLFDKPVEVVLSGVTGDVGYRPAGSSSWTRITNTCGGTYAVPAAPSFPGECAIASGTDTKIYTYHLTSFAGITANPPASPESPPSVTGGGAVVVLYSSATGFAAENGAPANSQGTIVEIPLLAGQVLGAQAFANGTLIRGNDKKIYAVINDRYKWYISSLAELRNSFSGRPIIKVGDAVLAQYQTMPGNRLYKNGELIRGNDKRIYAIINGRKQYISSLAELARSHRNKVINNVSDNITQAY